MTDPFDTVREALSAGYVTGDALMNAEAALASIEERLNEAMLRNVEYLRRAEAAERDREHIFRDLERVAAEQRVAELVAWWAA